MPIWIKPLLLLAWSLSLVEANWLFDEPEHVPDLNFGSLRIAVLIHANGTEECDEDAFDDAFYDGLTHAVDLAIQVERNDGPGGDDHRHIFFPHTMWDNILHREARNVNGGLIWQHEQGKHNDQRELLFGYGEAEVHDAVDPFCRHMHMAAPRDRYVECSCTGSWCHPQVLRRQLGQVEASYEGEVEDEVEDHVVEQDHRELKKERSTIMNRFEQTYNVPLLSFSWAGQKAAVDYIKEVLADKRITPSCFNDDKDPIVVIGMTMFYTK